MLKKGLILFGILVVFWAVSAPLLASLLIVEKEIERPNAILVLGGGAAYVERTKFAAEKYKAGVADRILLTNDGLKGGWDAAENRNPFFWELAKRSLIANGVPEEAIVFLPQKVVSTHDEAQKVAETAGSAGYGRILIVTSPHHTRRALATFERAGKDRVEYGIASPQSDLGAFWWLSGRGLNRIGLEFVKIGYYWVNER